MADIFNLTDSWNNGTTTFDAIKINVADTASGGSSRLLRLERNGTPQVSVDKFGEMSLEGGVRVGFATITAVFNFSGAAVRDAGRYAWSSTSAATGSIDTQLLRGGAGIVNIRGSSSSVGGAINLLERTAPAAPAANEAVLFLEDDGAGKSRLMVRFATGAAQQVAIEP